MDNLAFLISCARNMFEMILKVFQVSKKMFPNESGINRAWRNPSKKIAIVCVSPKMLKAVLRNQRYGSCLKCRIVP